MAEPKIPDISQMMATFDATLFMAKEVENDANGNALYIGYARPGSATSASVWLITKQTYDGNDALTKQEVANDVPLFAYAWDSRATYF